MKLQYSVLFSPTRTELEKARINLEALKKQAEATNTEYDRLAAEHQILQVTREDWLFVTSVVLIL